MLVSIGLIQQSNLSSDLEQNKRQLLASIHSLGPNSDFVLATELSTTPYFAVLHDEGIREDWGESLDGRFVAEIKSLAKQYQCTILLPVYLKESETKGANVILVIGSSGELIEGQDAGGRTYPYYSKVHLPDAWRDDKGLDEPWFFEPGTGFPVFKTDKGTVGMMICYDRRFPEAWRSMALAGAEMVFMAGCIPVWNPGALAGTSDMFVTELRTRASENSLFVVACGRAGPQTLQHVSSNFVGKSCVIDPAGAVLAELPNDEAKDEIVQINLADVTRVRKRLTLFRDRRPEAYQL